MFSFKKQPLGVLKKRCYFLAADVNILIDSLVLEEQLTILE